MIASPTRDQRTGEEMERCASQQSVSSERVRLMALSFKLIAMLYVRSCTCERLCIIVCAIATPPLYGCVFVSIPLPISLNMDTSYTHAHTHAYTHTHTHTHARLHSRTVVKIHRCSGLQAGLRSQDPGGGQLFRRQVQLPHAAVRQRVLPALLVHHRYVPYMKQIFLNVFFLFFLQSDLSL